MVGTTRRALLAGAAGAAAVGVLGAPVASARVRLTREEHRAVVVGSGYGGGVAALRLAQAGVQVTVLERGRRWVSGPNATIFPRMSSLDNRAVFHGAASEHVDSLVSLLPIRLDVDPYVGLLEPVGGENTLSLCAAGVGGGSLVGHGTTMRPAETAFATWLPEKLDWKRMDAVYYPRVATMLKIAVAPDELVVSQNYAAARIFADQIGRAGFTVEKLLTPIDWNHALAELRGAVKPCYTNGDTTLGVNTGGKHSVDVTYLRQAEATGRVTVATHHNVTSVARTADGKWEIRADRTDDTGHVVEQKVLTAKALVMAAGSIGTTRLLVRAKATGAIPDLPDEVGQGWGTNGDRVYLWTDFEEEFGTVQGGPAVFGTTDRTDPATANTVIQAPLPPLAANPRTTMLLGCAASADRGHFRHNPTTDTVDLHWPASGDTTSTKAMDARVNAITKGFGGALNTSTVLNTTCQPLGGAAMGPVCDLDGRVHHQPGLYVLDGALIPGTTAGYPPSMTIAAITERALDNIIASDIGTVI